MLMEDVLENGLGNQQINYLRDMFFEYLQDMNIKYTEAALDMSQMLGEAVNEQAIRHFAKNQNYKNPGEDFLSSPATRSAIARYLSHAGVMSAEELAKARFIDQGVPDRLVDFFYADQPDLGKGYSGSFVGISKGNRRHPVDRTLLFKRVPNKPYLTVSEQVFYHHGKDGAEHQARLDGTKAQYRGWGVFIQADHLLILVKDVIEQKKHCYLAVGTPDRLSDTQRINRMAFVLQDELVSIDWLLGKTKQEFFTDQERFLYEFQRVEEFSGISDIRAYIMDKEKEYRDAMKKAQRGRLDERSAAFLKRTRFKQDATIDPGSFTAQTERNVMDGDKRYVLSQEFLGRQITEAIVQYSHETFVGLLEMDTEHNKEAEHSAVNYVDPENGATPFHIAAAFGNWQALEALLETGKCNLLLRDSQGRLTSSLASCGHAEGAIKMEWCGKLRTLQIEQGKEAGVIPRIRGDVPIPEGPG